MLQVQHYCCRTRNGWVYLWGRCLLHATVCSEKSINITCLSSNHMQLIALSNSNETNKWHKDLHLTRTGCRCQLSRPISLVQGREILSRLTWLGGWAWWRSSCMCLACPWVIGGKHLFPYNFWRQHADGVMISPLAALMLLSSNRITVILHNQASSCSCSCFASIQQTRLCINYSIMLFLHQYQ